MFAATASTANCWFSWCHYSGPWINVQCDWWSDIYTPNILLIVDIACGGCGGCLQTTIIQWTLRIFVLRCWKRKLMMNEYNMQRYKWYIITYIQVLNLYSALSFFLCWYVSRPCFRIFLVFGPLSAIIFWIVCVSPSLPGEPIEYPAWPIISWKENWERNTYWIKSDAIFRVETLEMGE